MAAVAADGIAGKSNYGICLSLQRLTKQKEKSLRNDFGPE